MATIRVFRRYNPVFDSDTVYSYGLCLFGSLRGFEIIIQINNTSTPAFRIRSDEADKREPD